MAKAKDSSNGKSLVVRNPKLDEMVSCYLQLRDKLKECETAYEEHVKPIVDKMQEISDDLRVFLDQIGAQTVRTDLGTVYINTEWSVKAEDKDAFIKYVMKTGNYELLDRRPNKTACREFTEEHDTPPPGVTISSIRTARVRAPS